MSKKITLLGSTGSIGTQSLDVIRAQGYEVFGLSAHSQTDKDFAADRRVPPEIRLHDRPGRRRKAGRCAGRPGNAPKLLTGPEGLKELAAMDGPDVVLNSVVGIAGPWCQPVRHREAATIWHWPTRKALLPAVIWSRRLWKSTVCSCCPWTVSTRPSSSACRIRKALRA